MTLFSKRFEWVHEGLISRRLGKGFIFTIYHLYRVNFWLENDDCFFCLFGFKLHALSNQQTFNMLISFKFLLDHIFHARTYNTNTIFLTSSFSFLNIFPIKIYSHLIFLISRWLGRPFLRPIWRTFAFLGPASCVRGGGCGRILQRRKKQQK